MLVQRLQIVSLFTLAESRETIDAGLTFALDRPGFGTTAKDAIEREAVLTMCVVWEWPCAIWHRTARDRTLSERLFLPDMPYLLGGLDVASFTVRIIEEEPAVI